MPKRVIRVEDVDRPIEVASLLTEVFQGLRILKEKQAEIEKYNAEVDKFNSTVKGE